MRRLIADVGGTDVRCAAVGTMATPARGNLASPNNPPPDPDRVNLAASGDSGLRDDAYHRLDD